VDDESCLVHSVVGTTINLAGIPKHSGLKINGWAPENFEITQGSSICPSADVSGLFTGEKFTYRL
jgi:hypothetical protein